MSGKHDDGGPAFGHGDRVHGGDAGMSLRDWFAGQALAGLLASGHPAYNLTDSDDQAFYAAFRAYTVADLMLVARSTHLRAKGEA